MGIPLLVEFYDELPEASNGDSRTWETRIRAALDRFRKQVQARYTEGTLHRLIEHSHPRVRRAALLALGLTGSMRRSNVVVAATLHDEDVVVRQFATDALWSLWFRGSTAANTRELYRLIELRDKKKKRAGLDALIVKDPKFAEVFNQRAILHFQSKDWLEAISDCQSVLKLNPYHFGAYSGMGRCYLEIGRERAALKAFRDALRIHPGLEDVEEAIRALESTSEGEERREEL